MTSWHDFNDAEPQVGFDLIPAGTLACVRLSLKPGGVDDPAQGWRGGVATRNPDTGAVYLSCTFIILNGEFARRRVLARIGLHSDKGPAWATMGRRFIKALLNSARHLLPTDTSPTAQQGRCIHSFAELDGLVVAVRIDIETDRRNGERRNTIHHVIEPDHAAYAALMTSAPPAPHASAPASSRASATAVTSTPKPTWAQ